MPLAIPNLEEVLEDRLTRCYLLEKDTILQKEELRLCAENPVYFLNNWAWTYDPREGGGLSSLPFLPVPKQAELIYWIQEREEKKEDGVVPKSRATGVTYTCCGYAVHGWLFRDGFRCGFGSRVIPYVDSSSNPKSIFWKIRDILRRLPLWMMPQGFSWKKHSTHANLINPANNASIMGEGGANIGRGDRTSIYFLDEAAHIEHAEQVEAALSMSTNVRIDLSTPMGNSNIFAQKVLGGKVPCFPVHWRDVPFLTQEMYDKYKEKYGVTITAQEWDIDFTASESGLCIPAIWVQAAIDLIEATWYADWSIEAGLDVGEESDLCVNLFRQGPVVRRIEDWTGCTTLESAWRARDYCIDETASLLRYDVDGIGSGIKGPLKLSEGKLPFKTIPVHFGGKPTETRWPDGRTSQEMFENLRAEMWWALRCRFEKAYEFREKGIEHNPDDMISIPRHPLLIAQLSMPKYFHKENGKIILQPKKDLPSSPDFADAAVLAFAPIRPKEFWVR